MKYWYINLPSLRFCNHISHVDLYSGMQVTNFLAMAAFPLFIAKPEQAHKTIKAVERAMHFLKF
jgi:hypothetical protein